MCSFNECSTVVAVAPIFSQEKEGKKIGCVLRTSTVRRTLKISSMKGCGEGWWGGNVCKRMWDWIGGDSEWEGCSRGSWKGGHKYCTQCGTFFLGEGAERRQKEEKESYSPPLLSFSSISSPYLLCPRLHYIFFPPPVFVQFGLGIYIACRHAHTDMVEKKGLGRLKQR